MVSSRGSVYRLATEERAGPKEVRLREFEARALTPLVHEHPQEYQRCGEGVMRSLIRATVAQTQHYGLDSEVSVIACAELYLMHGEDFYNHEPWALYVLANPELDAEMKVERLRSYTARGMK